MFRRSAATLAAALRTRAVASSWTASSVLAAQARHYAPTRSFVSLVNKATTATVGKTLAPALLSKRTYVSYPDDPVVADIVRVAHPSPPPCLRLRSPWSRLFF
eukprot:TRINITY_DN3762_c0_g1_i2.p1 TRINITY_DN3762_c0_g1~~TRINITY_DN3762_c0_g1_i2.p1  ORF type:complete len:103 (+),score=8.73 TRINITY_DN3762_c0_g1_i2:124-432(+)